MSRGIAKRNRRRKDRSITRRKKTSKRQSMIKKTSSWLIGKNWPGKTKNKNERRSKKPKTKREDYSR